MHIASAGFCRLIIMIAVVSCMPACQSQPTGGPAASQPEFVAPRVFGDIVIACTPAAVEAAHELVKVVREAGDIERAWLLYDAEAPCKPGDFTIKSENGGATTLVSFGLTHSVDAAIYNIVFVLMQGADGEPGTTASTARMKRYLCSAVRCELVEN